MATTRKRDSVWKAALTHTALAGQSVSVEQIIEETPASERTVREVLGVMADTPFLERDRMPDGSVRFIAGSAFDQTE